MGRASYDDSGDLKFIVKGNNVLYGECECPFDLRVKIGKKEVALDYETYCNTDGTLKVGYILDESNPYHK